MAECFFCTDKDEFKFMYWAEGVVHSIGVCGDIECIRKIPFKRISTVVPK